MVARRRTARWVLPHVRSVRLRLAALVLLAMLATVGVVVGLMFATADGLFLRQAISELQRQNQASSLQIEDLTDRAAASLLITRHNPDFEHLYEADPNNAPVRAAALQDIGEQLVYIQKTFAIDEICLINAHGAEDARCVEGQLARFDELSPDESRNPFFAPTLALSDGEVYRSIEPYVSPDSHRYVVAHATPLVLPDGEHVGILHFEIPLIWFAARVRETSLAGASSFLLDRNGDLIVPPLLHDAPEPDYWPPAFSEAHDSDDAFPHRGTWGSPGFRAMAASLRPDTSGAAAFADGGEDYEVVYQPTFAGHWILATVLPHSAIYAPATELVARTILLVVPLLLLGLVLTVWYGSRLLEPLKQLATALRAVGSGDLDQHLGSGRDDEIGQLGHAFDRCPGSCAARAANRRRPNKPYGPTKPATARCSKATRPCNCSSIQQVTRSSTLIPRRACTTATAAMSCCRCALTT